MSSSAAPPASNLRATIHVGASSVSMLIAERLAGKPPEMVDFLEQPLPLGRDVFRRGRISRGTTEHAVDIIRGFRESLLEAGIDFPQVERTVATNILAEADNSDVFVNRLQIACGLRLEVLDDGEMTRLIYLKTRRRLEDIPSMKRQNTLVVHVGPGNTRVLLFRKGRIDRYTSYRLGAHRTGEAVAATNVDGTALLRVIREQISGQISQLFLDYEGDKVEDLIVIGYEIQLLAPFLTSGDATQTSIKALRAFVNEAVELTEEERVRRYQLDFHTSDAIVPALETNLAIAEGFKLKSIRIPESDYERGIQLDLPVSTSLGTGFQGEVIRSARILGAKFKVDSKHAEHVAKLSSIIYEATSELHDLGEHDALLLEIAALLHECGGYISPRAHHKHSEYLIQNSEIFGLGGLDVTTVSLVARYHRQSGPSTRHAPYRSLLSPDRIRVAKLCAILRVADALERAHSQRVRDISVEITTDKLRLTLAGVADAAVERLAMKSKGDVFHDVFGLEVVLVEQA